MVSHRTAAGHSFDKPTRPGGGVVALVVAAMVVVLLGSPLPAQAPVRQPGAPPVFRAGVQLMEVDAVATDAAGRPVLDLTNEESQLYDDGERQEIAFFAAVSLPIQAPRETARRRAESASRPF